MSGIFWGILASALSVVNTGVYQRALSVAASYGGGAFFRAFFMNAVSFVLIGISVPFVPAIFGTGFSPFSESTLLLFAVVSVSVSGTVSGIMSQYAYANEKIGTLAPFWEAGRILTILSGFFIFSGTSVTAFVSAMLAGMGILAASVDLKNFRVNRYCSLLAVSGILRAYSAVCSGWIVLNLAPGPFVFSDMAIALAVTFVLALKEGFPKVSRRAYSRMGKGFFFNDVLWFASYLISLFLLKELGVVATSLLWMASMVATVAYGRFFLNERTERKTVALALFVAACVVFGAVA